MRKIIINTGDNGEFMLSNVAIAMLYKMKHKGCDVYPYKEYYDYDNHRSIYTASQTEHADILLTHDFGYSFIMEKVMKKFSNFHEFCILCHQVVETRHDPDLVHVIEVLGENAGANGTKPCIVEIEDNEKYIINENDGKETLFLKSKVNEWDWQ